MSKMTLVCESFHRINKNTLRGFAEIKVVELQLTIKDVAFHQKGISRWAALPSKPMLKGDVVIKDDTGKIKYVQVLLFASRAVADAFSSAAIKAVLEHAPDAFDEAPAASAASLADADVPF